MRYQLLRCLIGTVVVALILSGCAGSDFNWDKVRQVKPGMTQQEVTALLGPPNNVRSTAEGVTWAWAHVNMMAGSTRSVSVVFRDGKVVSAPQVPESFR